MPGGFRGKQLQVLTDGKCYINRLFATVEFRPKTIVPIGFVGVVVSFDGEEGEDKTGIEYKHGELVENRFTGRGLYILDEPEAALSPMRQMSLLSYINSLVKNDSQFLISTHSPILMAYPDADIYVLKDGGINLTAYENTEHYMITKQFINDPKRTLHYLFEQV